MECLNCENQLTPIAARFNKVNLSYSVCETCNSLWIDYDEIRKLDFDTKTLLNSTSIPKTGTKEDCPKCEGVKLEKATFKQAEYITLDHCRKCGGSWIDSGDNERICVEDVALAVEGDVFSSFLKDLHLLFWERNNETKKRAESDKEYIPIEYSKLKGSTDYSCPACNTKMNNYKAYGIDIEGCTCCGGIWLDKDELRRLKDSSTRGAWTTLRWMDDEVESIEESSARTSKRSCPKCSSIKLVSTCLKNTGIVVDRCNSCDGVWLDRDEIYAIIQHLRKQLLGELTTEDMKKKVYDEIKEIWDGPENILSEIIDAKAAISALLCISVYEHPLLVKILMGLSGSGFPR